MNEHTTQPAFDEWVVIELFGRVRYAGRVSEQTIAGTGFVRLDVPAVDGRPAETHLYGPAAVYALHPTTEAVATAVAARCRPEPVHRWKLPAVPERDPIDIDPDPDRPFNDTVDDSDDLDFAWVPDDGEDDPDVAAPSVEPRPFPPLGPVGRSMLTTPEETR